MKFKLIIPFVLLVFSLTLVNCSKEPASLNFEETSIEANATIRQNTTPCNTTGMPNPCDPNYVFPIQIGGGTPLLINYDTTLTEEEVICIRYQYFMCFSYLRMSVIQSSNIHLDYWRTNGRPDDEVSNAACEDPRMGTSGCDE